jgi:hypothetical protein
VPKNLKNTKPMERLIKQEKAGKKLEAVTTPTPTPTPDVEPLDVKQAREDRENPMIQEGRKRASEPTGAWRQRQGQGKPGVFDNEY